MESEGEQGAIDIFEFLDFFLDFFVFDSFGNFEKFFERNGLMVIKCKNGFFVRRRKIGFVEFVNSVKANFLGKVRRNSVKDVVIRDLKILQFHSCNVF